MSIATQIQRLQGAKAALATSIENKGVTVPSSTKLDGYAALVDQIQQGGDTIVIDNTVYGQGSRNSIIGADGNVLKSYDSTELAELTALPALPQLPGLTGVDWSMTVAQFKAAPLGTVIYPRYQLNDDNLHIFISLPKGGIRIEMFKELHQPYTGGAFVRSTKTVNWGDGSATTSLDTTSHTYASAGDYEIVVSSPNDTWKGLTDIFEKCYTTVPYVMAIYIPRTYFVDATPYNSAMALTNNAANGGDALNYRGFLTAKNGFVVVDDRWTLNMQFQYAFGNTNIYGINLSPSQVPNLGAYMFVNSKLTAIYSDSNVYVGNAGGVFAGCRNLVTVPPTNGDVPSQAFMWCESLRNITIGGGTSIGDNAFSMEGVSFKVSSGNWGPFSNKALSEVHIASTITNIASSAFSYSDDDTVYYLEATTPPTLSGYLNGKWYVPRAALADYAEATNWWAMYEDGQVLAYDY